MTLNHSGKFLVLLAFLVGLNLSAHAQSSSNAIFSHTEAFFSIRSVEAVDKTEDQSRDDSPLTKLDGPDNLCALLIHQAELYAENHLNGSRWPELVVVDNPAARSLTCPLVFDRPIKLMRMEDISRARVTAYIEFESITQHETNQASAKYKLICTNGCSSWQFDLKLKIYEGTSNWAIIHNASSPIRAELINK